jgi:hypothetical protein
MVGGIARGEKISILYMPTLLRTQLRVRRRERRAYGDVSRNNHFLGGSMATRKKAKKATKKGAKKAKKTVKRRKKAAKKAKK